MPDDVTGCRWAKGRMQALSAWDGQEGGSSSCSHKHTLLAQQQLAEGTGGANEIPSGAVCVGLAAWHWLAAVMPTCSALMACNTHTVNAHRHALHVRA